MQTVGEVIRDERTRQLEHWRLAAERLGDLEALAPAASWSALEHYVGIALRDALAGAVRRLRAQVEALSQRLRAGAGDGPALRDDLLHVRQAFLRTETTLDFFADALATRANPRTSALLRACDHLATRSLAEVLTPLGRQVPPVLTYLDRGLGASILKAGTRMYDPGTENPVAAIKVVRHNLLRPTSLIHEAGHQVAHLLDWNRPLADALREAAHRFSPAVAPLWASWASEIGADAFAFAHTGFAALAAMRDVVDGPSDDVFRILPGDPHPPGWLRVLLGAQMCRSAFGVGPWDPLQTAWLGEHPLERCPPEARPLFDLSARAMPGIVDAILYRPFASFGNRPLTALIDPRRVSPGALVRLELELGGAAFKPYSVWNEALRILALTGYRAGLDPRRSSAAIADQERFMFVLGGQQQAA